VVVFEVKDESGECNRDKKGAKQLFPTVFFRRRSFHPSSFKLDSRLPNSFQCSSTTHPIQAVLRPPLLLAFGSFPRSFLLSLPLFLPLLPVFALLHTGRARYRPPGRHIELLEPRKDDAATREEVWGGRKREKGK
jgi:hypothetical protein